MRKITCVLINIVLFISVRHFALLCAFLIGMGASNHYIYEAYIYIPLTAIQLLFLIHRASNHNKMKRSFSVTDYLYAVMTITLLTLLTQFAIIPYSVIPH